MLPSIEQLSDAAGVEVVVVEIPECERTAPASRSVQDMVHPLLSASQLKPLPPPHVAIVPHGRLTGDSGAVVTAEGQLVLETLWDRPHWQRRFNPPTLLPAPVRLPGRHASLISLWSENNYHHWLFEALPRLALLQRSGVDFDSLIVPDPLTRFQRETLELLGVRADQLVPFTGTHVEPDELVWAAPLSPFEQPTPFTISWLRGMASTSAKVPQERIYIPRTTARRVQNERAVLRLLGDFGFRVVNPEGMSVREQIELFSTTRFMLGSHGAAFSNGIFSSQLTAIELFQDHHVNISTTAAIVAAGHDHWSITCERVPSLRRRRNQDLRVSLDVLTETLLAGGAGEHVRG